MPPNNSQQPTILVKKADGSSVRMTLVEFKKMREKKNEVEQKKITEVENKKGGEKKEETRNLILETRERKVIPPAPTTPAQVNEKPKLAKPPVKDVFTVKIKPKPRPASNLPAEEPPHELSTTTPVKDIFVDEAKSLEHLSTLSPKHKESVVAEKRGASALESKDVEKKAGWGEDDHKSLLEEDLLEGVKGPGVFESHKGILQKVLSQLDFKIPADLQSRLDMLVKLHAKGIRTDEQVLDYAQREVGTGGLGLSAENSKKLLLAVKEIAGVPEGRSGRKTRAVKVPLSKPTPAMPNKETSAKPVVDPAKMNVFRDKLQAVGRPPAGQSPWKEAKPVLHDIRPSAEAEAKRGVGPVDEMRMFSLKDFRRLSSDTKTAKEILLQKFETLREESYLLFFEAVKAWYQSPLYKEYQAVIKQALDSGQKIENVFSADSLQPEEFKAIVNINKQL